MEAEYFKLSAEPARPKRSVVIGVNGEQGNKLVSFRPGLAKMLPARWIVNSFVCPPGGDLDRVTAYVDNTRL